MKIRQMIIIIFALLLLIGCTTSTPTTNEPLKLTITELAEFDGKDGNKAYIAVDGIIYDVTDNPNWGNGLHNGFEAGKDLTKEIKEASPHGVSKLKDVIKVGEIKK